MTRDIAAVVTVSVLVILTGALATLPIGVSEQPLAEPLASLPHALGTWTASDEAVPACAMPPDRRARDHLVRTYRRDGQTVWMSVTFVPMQERGLRLRAPELLLSGHGSSELTARSGEVVVAAAGRRSIPVNLVITRAAGCDAALQYWYELGGRAVASDHGYRVLLLYHRVVHGRSDGALVRVASPMPDASDVASIVEAQQDFIRVLHAALRRSLPR